MHGMSDSVAVHIPVAKKTVTILFGACCVVQEPAL